MSKMMGIGLVCDASHVDLEPLCGGYEYEMENGTRDPFVPAVVKIRLGFHETEFFVAVMGGGTIKNGPYYLHRKRSE